MLRWVRRLRMIGAEKLSIPGLLALEFITIVLAIVLGLLVNEGRENYQRKIALETAMQSLAQEFEFNHTRLEFALSYQMKMLEAIEGYREQHPDQELSRVYGYQLEGWHGLQIPMLRSSSFEMLVSTGRIADLRFEWANNLATVYTMQDLAQQLDQANLIRFVNDPGASNLDSVSHMFSLYKDVLPSLLLMYQVLAEPMLSTYGYQFEITDEKVKALMNTHKEGMPEFMEPQ